MTIWVKVPEGDVTGRTMQALLQSLALQIRAEHMERRVTRFGTDRETRRIIVEFEEGGWRMILCAKYEPPEPEGNYDCHQCQDTGEVEFYYEDEETGEWLTGRVPCPWCGGTAKEDEQ